MLSKVGVLVTLIIFIALTLGAVALFIPYWHITESTSTLEIALMKTKTYTGLWYTCWKNTFSTDNDYGCDSLLDTPKDTDGLKAAQAVTVIGLAIVCTAFVFSVADLLCFEKKCCGKVVGVFAILAGLVLIISPIVYGTAVKDDYMFDVTDLNAGFALIVLTSVLSILAGIIACFA